MTNPIEKIVYHEQVDVNGPYKDRLLIEKTHKYFQVSCPKALVNCILQREVLKQDSLFRVYPKELGSIFTKLKLEIYFKFDEIDEWVGGCKGFLLGELLALHIVLHSLDIFINSVEDIMYTTLVEKPDCFVCLYNDGWVVLRNISSQWYLLDSRTPPERISENYFNMIVVQMIKENVPIFSLSGGEFSRSLTIPENLSLPTSTNEYSDENASLEGLISEMSAVKLSNFEVVDTVTHELPEDNANCCVCLEEPPDHAFYPCGHQCICSQCKSNIMDTFKKCPICKVNVTDVIKIFKS